MVLILVGKKMGNGVAHAAFISIFYLILFKRYFLKGILFKREINVRLFLISFSEGERNDGK